MKEKRSILFYIWGLGKGIQPCTFDQADQNKPLAFAFEKVVTGMVVTQGDPVPKPDFLLGFDFYDWHLMSISGDIAIGRISNPGIVLALPKTLGDTQSVASAVKSMAENVNDTSQHKLLDDFLSGAKGHIDSKGVTGLLSSVEMKPGIAGFKVDLKKLCLNLFRRREK